jgi:hypothetical protein
MLSNFKGCHLRVWGNLYNNGASKIHVHVNMYVSIEKETVERIVLSCTGKPNFLEQSVLQYRWQELLRVLCSFAIRCMLVPNSKGNKSGLD